MLDEIKGCVLLDEGMIELICDPRTQAIRELVITTPKVLKEEKSEIKSLKNNKDEKLENDILRFLIFPDKITKENANNLFPDVVKNLHSEIQVSPNGNLSLLYEYKKDGQIYSEVQKFVLISNLENFDSTKTFLYCNNSITPNSNRKSKRDIEREIQQNDIGGHLI